MRVCVLVSRSVISLVERALSSFPVLTNHDRVGSYYYCSAFVLKHAIFMRETRFHCLSRSSRLQSYTMSRNSEIQCC
uniref:Uncharacterized protein n=1 Tax=Solanum lycopersicum TaxID=4081 RepID=A0A3Q7EY74_SOLLC